MGKVAPWCHFSVGPRQSCRILQDVSVPALNLGLRRQKCLRPGYNVAETEPSCRGTETMLRNFPGQGGLALDELGNMTLDTEISQQSKINWHQFNSLAIQISAWIAR